MTGLRALLLLYSLALCLGCVARASPLADVVSPQNRLVPAEISADWRALLEELRSKPPLFATFTERRYFPFKKASSQLTGELRLDPARGLSLRYLAPEERTLVIDSQGALMIDERGRRRELPRDPRAVAATSALLHVLRFDLNALASQFDLYAALEGSDWRFAFVPKPAGPASLQPVFVNGTDARVTGLEMRQADSQRIEITIGETRTGVTFSADELARYFR